MNATKRFLTAANALYGALSDIADFNWEIRGEVLKLGRVKRSVKDRENVLHFWANDSITNSLGYT